jgi:glycosyltransferase involved in cell wall biosynthesis
VALVSQIGPASAADFLSAGEVSLARVRAQGKFLVAGGKKLYVKGVTYGTFQPKEDGVQFPAPSLVSHDFRLMEASGINAIRTYTPPPVWLLDEAQKCGLYVMVGLPWEEHIAFLDEPGRADEIERRVRNAVRDCGNHPSVLAYVIGNEIPASIVRWHGARRIERFLHRLYTATKAEAPETLVTYVNFPTTEYLQLPFLDFFCFNVYLEQRDRLEAYLARLQNLAGDLPLVMAEVGLDSRRNGEITQAETLAWQVQAAFQAGCAGMFLFAWTDEWHRGGYEIEDWDFGLTRRDRTPKPALASARLAFSQLPFPREVVWPRVSVVVCTYNGSRTIRETLEGLVDLDYADYEVIVVDDGSTDGVDRIVKDYPVRLIQTENRGLSAARNTGMKAATGDIVAYIDDDAYPDPHWLQYLAWTFLTTSCAGVGGPNIPPAGDGPIAECVANSPGGPVHVLVSDVKAEHIPGCNCSFRREALLAVGGFDPVFRTAGDDVDLCWRLIERGWEIGFHHAAVVWHHRRNSLRTYWKQQKGYGKAEALLEKKWPSKYNVAGHVTWTGRLYGRGITHLLGRWRIYHGSWNCAPFQRLYEPAQGTLASLPLMPEWYLIVAAFLMVLVLEPLWHPLRFAAIPLAIAVLLPMLYVLRTAARSFGSRMPWPRRVLTICLYLAQPLARLWGRINHGLTPWRHHGRTEWAFPRHRLSHLWSEKWRSPQAWLQALEGALLQERASVARGREFDRWDLEIRGGLLGGSRFRIAVEEHGSGKQLLRLRSWPLCSPSGLGVGIIFAGLAAAAASEHAWIASALLGGFALWPLALALQGCARAQAALNRAINNLGANRS